MSYGWCSGPTKPWNIFAILTKGLRGTTFNDNLSMICYTYKKKPLKKIPHQSFKLDDFKMFISTLWYDNVNDYDFF